MINLGQVGAGAWGQNLLRNFFGLKDCVVKICCDKNNSVLEKIDSQYNHRIKVSRNYEDILKDKDIEAVVIATLPATHAKLAITALKRGKNVFVEKPMALDIAEAKEMIRTAKKFNRILMVGHLLLYHPAVRKMKSYIDQGLLGDVHYMYSTRVNLGQFRDKENALWSLTAHDISVALYLLKDVPVEVTAVGKSYLRKKIQDVVFVTLNFRNKTLAHIHASWLDPHKVRKFTIVGSKKMAVFDDMQASEKIRIYDKGYQWQKESRQKSAGAYDTFLTLREGDIHIPRVEMVEPLRLECRHFIECIVNKKQPFTDGENGLSVLRVLRAAQESLESNGKPVRL